MAKTEEYPNLKPVKPGVSLRKGKYKKTPDIIVASKSAPNIGYRSLLKQWHIASDTLLNAQFAAWKMTAIQLMQIRDDEKMDAASRIVATNVLHSIKTGNMFNMIKTLDVLIAREDRRAAQLAKMLIEHLQKVTPTGQEHLLAGIVEIMDSSPENQMEKLKELVDASKEIAKSEKKAKRNVLIIGGQTIDLHS